MNCFDTYGFRDQDNIHIIKERIEQAVGVELKYYSSGEHYMNPGFYDDIEFRLCYNEDCDEEGCFLRYRDFSEHIIILATYSESLKIIDDCRDKLVNKAKAELLRRAVICSP
jgi:hypothetical protein